LLTSSDLFMVGFSAFAVLVGIPCLVTGVGFSEEPSGARY